MSYWVYIAVEGEKIDDMMKCGMGEVYREQQTRKEGGGEKVKFTIKVRYFLFRKRKSDRYFGRMNLSL